MESLSEYARKYLIVEGVKCGRHCSRPVRFAVLSEDSDEITGAYVDPDAYVSRVVYFSLVPNLEWFRSFLKSQVGEKLKDSDLRFATRHGWEFGREGERDARSVLSKSRAITEYYWTHYPKTEEDKKSGTYLCSKAHGGCGKRLFVRSEGDDEKLCDLCRA